jgi:hypothetical protein
MFELVALVTQRLKPRSFFFILWRGLKPRPFKHPASLARCTQRVGMTSAMDSGRVRDSTMNVKIPTSGKSGQKWGTR